MVGLCSGLLSMHAIGLAAACEVSSVRHTRALGYASLRQGILVHGLEGILQRTGKAAQIE